MTYANNSKTKEATLDWLKSFDTTGFEFVTLLMKQSTRKECLDGVLRTDVLEEMKASRCFREFHNRLSRKVLQNDYRLRKRKLRVVPFLERKNGHLHYHVGIENPYVGELGKAKFVSLVNLYWRQCPFAFADRINPKTGMYEGRSVKSITTYDGYWIDYCLKNQKNNTNDLDTANLHLG